MNWKKVWDFIWNDDSIWSWLLNVLLAFILVKFIIYPGLGLLFATSHPIVAVVSGSMEHEGSFESWWSQQSVLYDQLKISKSQFENFSFTNGFNKGDIMIIYSKKNLKVGDVIVFVGSTTEPIIHRIVLLNEDGTITTKGDNNSGIRSDEAKITKDKVIGKAVIRIPYLGWFKIGFVYLLSSLKSLIL